MVLMLPRRQTFGEKLGLGLGAGLAQGVEQGGKFAMEMAMDKAKMQQRLKNVQELAGGDQNQQPRNFKDEFLNMLPEIENKAGRELTPQDLDNVWSQLTEQSDQNQNQNNFSLAEKYSLIGEPELARIETEKGKIAAKERSKKEDREYAASEKYLDEARKSKEELFGQQTSIDSAMQAVREGKDLNQDWWADFLGLEQLRTAPGAVVAGTAKTHMLSAMNNLSGGRPNMFLEKQIAQAFALPGASPEANMAKLEILKALADMKQAQVDKAFEIENQFEQKGKPVPGKIGRLALKEAQPEIEKRQKTLAYKLQDLMEPKEGSEALQSIEKVSKGTPLTRKKAEVLFKEANPEADMQNPTEDEIARAIQLAEGLGYDVYAMDNLE